MPRDLAPIDIRGRAPLSLAVLLRRPRRTSRRRAGTEEPRPASNRSSRRPASAAASPSSAADRAKRGRRRRRPSSALRKQQSTNATAAQRTRHRQDKRPKDFILRRAPKHYNHWTPDHVRNILRAKIECSSKRRENRNKRALQLLGGSVKNVGITARQLRRRCLRQGIPLSRVQSEVLFRSIEGGTGATSMSLHRFLLGLFPDDYDAKRIANLNLNQTLTGMSEIERKLKLGISGHAQKKINRPTLSWPPALMLKKLQQQIVKRGGGLAEALKRYSVIRTDEKSATRGTTLGREEMRQVIARIFRIPASDKECDNFFKCLAGSVDARITFAHLFRKLDGGSCRRAHSARQLE